MPEGSEMSWGGSVRSYGGDPLLRLKDEVLADRLWKEILKEKGLPLDTPYVLEDEFFGNKTRKEFYCYFLHQQIWAKNRHKPKSDASEETDAGLLWKEILKEKGLPLDTPYVLENEFVCNKSRKEYLCDYLHQKIWLEKRQLRKRKRNESDDKEEEEKEKMSKVMKKSVEDLALNEQVMKQIWEKQEKQEKRLMELRNKRDKAKKRVKEAKKRVKEARKKLKKKA